MRSAFKKEVMIRQIEPEMPFATEVGKVGSCFISPACGMFAYLHSLNVLTPLCAALWSLGCD